MTGVLEAVGALEGVPAEGVEAIGALGAAIGASIRKNVSYKV